MKKKIVGVSIIISILIISVLIVNNNRKTLKAEDYKNVIDNLNFSIQNINASDKGDLITVKIKNNSDFRIYSNNIYFNYPLKQGTSYTENKYKIEALINKNVIEPREEINVSVLIPIGDFIMEDRLEKNFLYYDYEGYINNISGKTSFFTNNYITIH